MMKINEQTATADELWDYYMIEYESRNPLSRLLFDNYYSSIRRLVKEFNPDDRLLEVGCGPGESSRRIASLLHGQYFEASDYDERLVAKLQATNQPFTVTRESVYELRRADREFDVVFLLEVLEHLDDYNLALKEVFRVASRSVVLSVPNEPLWSILNMLRGRYLRGFGNTPGHVNRWSKRDLINLVSRFGTIRRIVLPVPWIIICADVVDKNDDNVTGR